MERKCQKCKKLFADELFDTNTRTGDKYSCCRDCRLINNQHSRESYQRKDKFVCPECKRSYSTKSVLKQHLWRVHDIGDGQWFACEHCPEEKKFKSNGDLTQHLWRVHDIGNGQWYYCEHCPEEKKFKFNNDLTKHLWGVHEIGDRQWYYCEHCTDEKKFKFNNDLTQHLWRVHDIGDGECFACEHCPEEKKFKTSGELKRHLWRVHDIGDGEWFACEHCPEEKKFKTSGELKRHLWRIHEIGDGQWYYCEYCSDEKKFKTNGGLTQHLWQVHEIGNGQWYSCDYCPEEKKFKTNGHLTRHLWQVHEIGDGQWYYCEYCPDEKKFKTNSELIQHLWGVHEIGDGQWYYCEYCPDEKKFKTNGGLTKHHWRVHEIGDGQWFACDHCPYNSKCKSNLTRHLQSVHDIGKKECQICFKKCYQLELYTDQHDNKIKICKACYFTATGSYTTRKEKQMVEHLRKKFGNYFVLTDQIVSGHTCNTKRRPDLLIASSHRLQILIECDENQHQGYVQECEEARISEIIDELSPPNQKFQLVVIRWNPDHYKVNGHRGGKTRHQRLELLEKLIMQILTQPTWQDTDFAIHYYMFYNRDNESVVSTYQTRFINHEQDLQTAFDELNN